MRMTTSRFFGNNYWALDSTFKTNQYHLPLYATIVPNQDGIVVPIFYVLCSNDIKQDHKGITLELILTHVFGSFGEIRPSVIVIDKDKTSLIANTNVVNKNVYCWSTDGDTRI